ncbi:hypothetical protein Tco_0386363, partial [Tanacetum coccineum]
RAPRNQDNKNKESSRRSVPVETSTSIALVSCDGLGGYDWSDQAEEGPNYVVMAYSSSSSDSENESVYVEKINGLKWDIQVGEITIRELRKNDDAPIIEEWVSDSEEENVSQTKTEKKTVKPSIAKIEFVKPKQQEKTARKTVKQLELLNKMELLRGGIGHFLSIKAARTYAYNSPNVLQNSKSSHDDGSKPSSDYGNKVDEDPSKNSECNDQEKEDNVNSTNTVNAAGINEVNVVGGKTSIELPFDPNMSALENVSIFDFSRNDDDVGVEADINNLDITIQVGYIPLQ